MVDGFGLAVAGLRSAPGSLATRYAAEFADGGRDGARQPGARPPGTGTRLPARFAAFANGVRIHADDFDDTQLAVAADRVYGLLTHPTAPVLPAAPAVAERARPERHRPAARLHGRGGGGDQGGRGDQPPALPGRLPLHRQRLGTIGAAAAAANLLGLDPAATARVLGLAASQAGGLRENFGTMTKPFHAGRAAENRRRRRRPGRRGWTAAPDILEADRGFFRAAGGGFDPSLISGQLGAPWTFVEPGRLDQAVSVRLAHPSGHVRAGRHRDRPDDIKPGDIAGSTWARTGTCPTR